MSNGTTPNPSVAPKLSKDKPSRDKLEAWLKGQATKLKTLNAKGQRLKLDYVQNARDKGALLIEVEKRVSHILGRFQVWVTTDGGIGYSTALLYMDVAKNYDAVKERFANSNPLELTLRQVRDAIRDARQEEGGGKPGSGGRKAIKSATPSPGEEGTETGEAGTPISYAKRDDSAIAEAKHKKLMGRFEPGGDMHNTGDNTKPAPLPSIYKLTVVTPTKADLEAFGNLLPSPTIDLKAHSVSAQIGLTDINDTLAAVGKALTVSQPKKVRIVVEL
jgi:hypothetical protein